MKTIVLLALSNVFMTFAWHGHLEYRNTPLLLVILISWGIAFFEYCLQVPANRWGHGQFSAAQGRAGGVPLELSDRISPDRRRGICYLPRVVSAARS